MADALQQQQDNYQFSAKPQVVNGRSQKFRDPNSLPTNIMWDKRVVRGNTYSSIVTQKIDIHPSPSNQSRPRLQQLQEVVADDTDSQLAGQRKREHQEVQTDDNVEELTNKPPNYEKECQTDYLMVKDVERIYLPVKDGNDKETQIWDDGELFNFDYEVEPILQVLIGKTLETSRLEVLEEEELKYMNEQQRYFTQLRQAEVVEQERLEQVEMKLYQENLKRLVVFGQKKNLCIQAHEKLVSRVLSKQFLNRLIKSSKDGLREQGFFRSDVVVDLHRQFIPWLYTEIEDELIKSNINEDETLDILKTIEFRLQTEHKEVHNVEMGKRADIILEREKRRMQDEERKIKRREARRVRLEQERRTRMRDTVVDKLYTKGELKIPALNHVISDIDANQGTQPVVGLFGGVIGELVIFISCLFELGYDNQYSSFRSLNSPEIIDELVTITLQSLSLNPDTYIEYPVSALAEPLLEKIEQGLTIVGLNTSVISSTNLQKILIDNLYSVILMTISIQIVQLGLSQDIYQGVIKSFVKNSIANELIRPKIRFVKVNPEIKGFSQAALVKVSPNLEDLPFHTKSNKFRHDGSDPDEEIINPINLAEADVTNKTTIFPSQLDDLRILILHPVAELKLREIVIESLGEVLSLDVDKQYNVMMNVIDKCSDYQNSILALIVNELPQLELGQQ